MASRLLEHKKESGPESVAFFAGYPKWLRPFLRRLCLMFGSPNYMTESSTCSAAASLAFNLNYGAEPGPDLAKTKCLLVWSRNPAFSNNPMARSLTKLMKKGIPIIDVGPMFTPLSAKAAIHLRNRPGTSGALALGMARVIVDNDLFDHEFIYEYSHGFNEFREYIQKFTPEKTEEITGVPKELMEKAARMYASVKPAAMLTSPNATVHHTNGVQNHRALTALIGLTGNFDAPGGNKVMPGCYLFVKNGHTTRQKEFENPVCIEDMPPRVGQAEHPLWCRFTGQAQAMHLPGWLEKQKPYPIRSLVAFGLNYRMWPAPDLVKKSLAELEFLVDVDLFLTDSAKLADLILPACSSFERSEFKAYPENYAIYTTPALEPLGESRPDVDIICDLAQRLTPDDELLTKGHEACLDWMLKPMDMTVADFKGCLKGRELPPPKPVPYYKYKVKGFDTPSGKMEFSSEKLARQGMSPLPEYQEPGLSPAGSPRAARKFPLILTTGFRLPMFIHSRTFRVPWLRALHPGPMVDVNPLDARERGLSHGDLVELSTKRGAIKVRANITEMVPPKVVSMYHAWPGADVNLLIEPDYQDPISGYPGFKSLICQVSLVEKDIP
jgi:anaerobic selenocysteine-containing dehydrogenase